MAGRPQTNRAPRLGIAAVVGLLIAIVAPGAVLAANDPIKLALTPVGETGTYFDLTMRPGETRRLEVLIRNDGTAALVVRTYAADVYTIINGGFGGRLRDEPQTDTTRWLDYATTVVDLPVGKDLRRSLTVTVPRDAGPGEYISSVVLENDKPLPGVGDVALAQVIRQAVAVVVTVPGVRAPELTIGAATHQVVAGKSVVSVAVANTGNVRLKPLVAFTLFDAAGAQVSAASVQMDTFYARTSTFVEVPLEALLLPGTYTVHLSLDDAAQRASADSPAILIVVTAPPAPAPSDGAVTGLTGVDQSIGNSPFAIPAWALVAILLVAAGVGLVALAYRRRHAANERRPW